MIGRDEQVTPPIVTRVFLGRRAESDDAMANISQESQAGLRQYSIDRMMGYGIDYSDAVELRARVLDGQDWCAAATAVAATALGHVERAPEDAAKPTRVAYLRRASALLRMSQALMLSDTPERRSIFATAAELYAQAAELMNNRSHVLLETEHGKLAGWLISPEEDTAASAIVIGGVEGWAMDFDCMGEALAARGVEALMLDGPGQGETRFTHHHYLSANWPAAYRSAVDFLYERAPNRPIGFIGNSMGGSFAMAVTAADERIGACCNNGGPIAPGMAPREGTFFTKMMAACNATTAQEAADVWGTVLACAAGPNAGYPLLMLQGREDALVSTELSEVLLQKAPTDDKQMVVFSDGDHCIYRHKQDRDALIGDWMRARLCGRPRLEVQI